MSDSAVFQIPDEYRHGLEKLVLCEDKFIEKLFEAVKQSPPTLQHFILKILFHLL